jgi:hypothetical protein
VGTSEVGTRWERGVRSGKAGVDAGVNEGDDANESPSEANEGGYR